MGNQLTIEFTCIKYGDNPRKQNPKIRGCKKKRSHVNNPIVWIIGTAIAIKANVLQDLIEIIKKIGH